MDIDYDIELRKGVGLHNIGNTCFMNSALQIIIHCDVLSNYMLSNNFKTRLATTYKNFLEEYSASKKSIVPVDVKGIMGKKFKRFVGFGQEDSHEFLIEFLDYLEEDIKKEDVPDNEKKLISRLFDCEMKTIIKSLESNERSSHKENVRFLCVSIPNQQTITLEDCLRNFISMEKLDKDRLWETPSKKMEKAVKVSYITRFPKYLAFQVKRYNYKKGTGGSKLSTNIEIQDTWTSDMFGDGISYDLKGFIFQTGSLSGGHYTSYVKINNKWYCFNDSSVSKIEDHLALKVATKAYMVLYVKNEHFNLFDEEGNNSDSSEKKFKQIMECQINKLQGDENTKSGSESESESDLESDNDIIIKSKKKPSKRQKREERRKRKYVLKSS